MDSRPDPSLALASLRDRWGAAAPRRGTEVFGALAAAPAPAGWTRPAPAEQAVPTSGGVIIPTGFADLDALLAGGGLPRTGTVALAGAGSSGSTTLALRALASAQQQGALTAWIDCPRSLDPVEAVSRGVNLDWLAVLVPDSLGQALAMAGAMLQARAIDVLVLDLGPGREAAAGAPGLLAAGSPPGGTSAGSPPSRRAVQPGRATGPHPRQEPRPAEQLGRLVAFARRAGALLLVLVPPGAPPALRAALDEGAGLRLDLVRRSWIRLGREVVGQRTEVRVARDRHGAPDRRTALRILYAEGGPRDRCLARDELLVEEPVALPAGRPAPAARPVPAGPVFPFPFRQPRIQRPTDAPSPSLVATSRPPARPREPVGTAPARATGPGRAAVG